MQKLNMLIIVLMSSPITLNRMCTWVNMPPCFWTVLGLHLFKLQSYCCKSVSCVLSSQASCAHDTVSRAACRSAQWPPPSLWYLTHTEPCCAQHNLPVCGPEPTSPCVLWCARTDRVAGRPDSHVFIKVYKTSTKHIVYTTRSVENFVGTDN